VQVWSRDLGYPGDYNYLEFHKRNFPSGHRYWKISNKQNDLGNKEEYSPEEAFIKAREHAKHFVAGLEGLKLNGGQSPISNLQPPIPFIITSPFDTELFGHWWFEGPKFLSEILKNISQSKVVETITPSKYLQKYSPQEVLSLPEGSWGEGGKHYVWNNEETSYTWEKIYECEDKIWAIATNNNLLPPSLLKQLLVELLILQSSDWQFLITTQDAKDYSKERFNFHYKACLDLLNAYEINDEVTIKLLLNELKHKDFIFAEVEKTFSELFNQVL